MCSAALRDVAVLVNPAAGRGHAAVAGTRLIRALRTHGVRPQTLVGSDAAESVALARSAVEAEVDALVVVGGDGLLHEVLPTVSGTTVPLGIVPAGSGNDAARSLGLPRRSPEESARIVAAGHTRVIDLGRAGGALFATVLATGFDSCVSERAEAMRWPRGNARYNLAVAAELRSFEPIPYTLELDGAERQVEAMLVAVGNTPSYGGGLRICAGAVLDDGLLDVVLIKPVSRLELVRVFPRLYRGSHVHHRQYEHHRVSRISIAAPGITAYADGERLGPLPVTAESVPSALSVLVPPGA